VGWLLLGGLFGCPSALAQAGTDELDPLLFEAPEPASEPVSDGLRSRIERAWFESGHNVRQRGTRARRVALELGAPNVEAAARALIAADAGADRLANAALAVRLAPDLPMARMALAGAQWQEGEYRLALVELVQGVLAIARHPEASVWLVGSLLVMFSTVLVGGSLLFVLFVGLSVFSHAAHDAGDLISNRMPTFAGVALLCAALLVPIALGEGGLGLLLGFYAMAVVYGGSRYRMALALAGVLVVLGLYPVLELAGAALTALDADPIARATLAVVRGDVSPVQIEELEQVEDQDLLAAQALALHARRRGDDEEARVRYQRLLEQAPRDPVVLTNLANLHFGRGDTARAIELYEQAASVEESALLMFDLSQAYARDFQMKQFETAMQRAQGIDAELVAELSRFDDTQLVADLPIPMSTLRTRMLRSARDSSFSPAFAHALAPGWLGLGWLHTAGGFVGATLLGLLLVGRYQQASRCGRCGKRLCARCDDDMWSNELCDGCHHLFQRGEGTDPTLRMARLKALRERESRIERIGTVASMLVPGAAGLLARRPDLGFLGILLFAWAAVLFGWRNGVVSDPLAVGAAGPLAFVTCGLVMAVIYLAVLVSSLVIRRSL